MAKSTYYFEISKSDIVGKKNAELLNIIKEIFEQNKHRYGVRRVYQELINRGYKVNHKRVQRLMHEAGLFGKRPKEKYHSYKVEVGRIADNIIDRDFKRFPSVSGLIFHSDQGWQYQHAYFRNSLAEHGVIQSMSRKGNCYDNCIMETFFGRMKNEMYYGCEKEYKSFEMFAKAVEEYIDYYNNIRIQVKTKWIPPVKYREASMCSA